MQPSGGRLRLFEGQEPDFKKNVQRASCELCALHPRGNRVSQALIKHGCTRSALSKLAHPSKQSSRSLNLRSKCLTSFLGKQLINVQNSGQLIFFWSIKRLTLAALFPSFSFHWYYFVTFRSRSISMSTSAPETKRDVCWWGYCKNWQSTGLLNIIAAAVGVHWRLQHYINDGGRYRRHPWFCSGLSCPGHDGVAKTHQHNWHTHPLGWRWTESQRERE